MLAISPAGTSLNSGHDTTSDDQDLLNLRADTVTRSRMHHRWRAAIGSCVCALLLAAGGRAARHLAFDSDSMVRVFPDSVELTTRMSALLAWRLLGDTAPPEADDAGFAVAMPALRELAKSMLALETPAGRLSPHSVRVERGDGGEVRFVTIWPRPTARPLRVEACFLPQLDPMASTTVRVFDHAAATDDGDNEPDTGAVLTCGHPVMEVLPRQAGAAEPAGDGARPPDGRGAVPERAGFGSFLLLGVRHIVTGYDHLLFLLALLLGCRRAGPMLAIITSFTLAHSLTLALAATDVVRLPARTVEIAIAGSIVLVGAENLWRNDAPRARLW